MKPPTQSLTDALEKLVAGFRAHGRAAQLLRDNNRAITLTLARVKDAVAGDIGMELRATAVYGPIIEASFLLDVARRLELAPDGEPEHDQAVWRLRVRALPLDEVA